jgi:hypothetical protein
MSNNVKVINSFKVLLLQANAWCLAVFSGHHLGSHPPCHEGEVRTLWAKECTGLQFRNPRSHLNMAVFRSLSSLKREAKVKLDRQLPTTGR